jgi:hypothetical protein
LNERITTLLKEKERFMRDYASDIRLRESEMEAMRITFDEDLAKKDREKASMKVKLDDMTHKFVAIEKELGK